MGAFAKKISQIIADRYAGDQTKFAAAIGIHRVTVWRLRSGEELPKPETLRALVASLGEETGKELSDAYMQDVVQPRRKKRSALPLALAG